MSDAVLAIAAELSLEPVLEKLVHAARDLVAARYAALGVPDAEGTGFSRFLTAGMSDETIEAIGPLPRTHGLLGAMLSEPTPFRTLDITADPRFWGWPPAHPGMRSFLGVPIVSKGDVVGAFYLTDKEGAAGFDEGDQELIELLAAHAAIAMENARLFERSRELSVVEERNRLARELHDAMTQTLFGLALTADAAATLVRTDPERAEAEIRRVRQLATDTLAELRSLIFELRPAELEAEGFVATLAKHLDVLERAYGVEVSLEVDGGRRLPARVEAQLFRIVQEALNNVMRHAKAGAVAVRIAMAADTVTVEVRDDGVGFDPDARPIRSTRLGLTSMRERAQDLGGVLQIESQPGRGTAMRVAVPVG
jgi:signal transduction histidine kinase